MRDGVRQRRAAGGARGARTAVHRLHAVAQPPASLGLFLGFLVSGSVALSLASGLERAMALNATLSRILGGRRLLRPQNVSTAAAQRG